MVRTGLYNEVAPTTQRTLGRFLWNAARRPEAIDDWIARNHVLAIA
jgi:hypothetical protein